MMMLIVMTWSSLPSGPPRGNKTYQLQTDNWYKRLEHISLHPLFSSCFQHFLSSWHSLSLSSCMFYLFIFMLGRGEMTLIIVGRVADKQVLHISFPQISQSISTSCVFPLRTNPANLCPPDCPPVPLRLRTAWFLSHTIYTVQSTGGLWATTLPYSACVAH